MDMQKSAEGILGPGWTEGPNILEVGSFQLSDVDAERVHLACQDDRRRNC